MAPKPYHVESISKSFPRAPNDRLKVLDGISFRIEPGELLSILGPSGCGKTTLLKIIMGLVKTDSGAVYRGREIINYPDFDRAMVFQDINLLPWRTAIENIQFGLELKSKSTSAAPRIIEDILELVGLKDFRDYYPSQLSGGMKQRVGIARALVVEPSLLLLDEPFGSLDAITSETLQIELKRILRRTGQTAILVTHDIDEAILLGDRVIVLSEKPSSIKGTIQIKMIKKDLDPKIKLTSEFIEHKKQVWKLLRSENGKTTE